MWLRLLYVMGSILIFFLAFFSFVAHTRLRTRIHAIKKVLLLYCNLSFIVICLLLFIYRVRLLNILFQVVFTFSPSIYSSVNHLSGSSFISSQAILLFVMFVIFLAGLRFSRL